MMRNDEHLLKLEAEEEQLPLHKHFFPLSLCYPLPNLVNQGCRLLDSTTKKAAIKFCSFGRLQNIFLGIVGAYLTRKWFCWCTDLHWAVRLKAELFKMLQGFAIPLLPFGFITGQIRRAKWRWGKQAMWEKLPLDAVREIGSRLVSRLDVVRFRSVCKSWRLALPSPTLFPLRVPPPPICDPKRFPPPPICDPNVPYFLTELNIYLNSNYVPGHGFLYVAVEEVDRGGKFARLLTLFPDAWRVPESRGKWYMGTNKNHPLSGLIFCGKSYLVRRSEYAHRASVCYPSPILKAVVVSGSARVSSNAEGVNPSYVRASDLTAVAMLWDEPMRGRLAVLRLGDQNNDWDTGFCSHVFEDISTYKGKLCALDFSGSAYLMEYNSLQMTQIAHAQDITHVAYGKRLLEVDGELYLVDKSGEKSKKLLFYKLDWLRHEWVLAKHFIRQFLRTFMAYGPSWHCT